VENNRLAIVCHSQADWVAMGGTVPKYWGDDSKTICPLNEEFVAVVCTATDPDQVIHLGYFIEVDWNVDDPTVETLQQYLCH
jgi:hypothetical protein